MKHRPVRHPQPQPKQVGSHPKITQANSVPDSLGLTLVSPGARVHGGGNPEFHDIHGVGAWRCQDQVLA